MKSNENTQGQPWVTPINYVEKLENCENPDPISKMIDGQAYGIEELLIKYSNGLNPDIERNVKFIPEDQYELYEPLVKPDTDLTDIDNIRRKNQEMLSQLTKKTKKEPVKSDIQEPKGKGENEKSEETTKTTGDPE